MGCRSSKEDDASIPREGLVWSAWRAILGPSCFNSQKMLHALHPRNHKVPKYRRTFHCFNREIQFTLWVPREQDASPAVSEHPEERDPGRELDQDPELNATPKHQQVNSIAQVETRPGPGAGADCTGAEADAVEVEVEVISSSENTELDCSINTVVEVCPETHHLRDDAARTPSRTPEVADDDASLSEPRPRQTEVNAVSSRVFAEDSILPADDGSTTLETAI